MGCGSSTQGLHGRNAHGSMPRKADKGANDNATNTFRDGDSDVSSDDSAQMRLREGKARSKSVSRLEALAKEREPDDEPEMFLWGDFVVDINQVNKKPAAAKRNPRHSFRQRTGKKKDGDTFQFSDFFISMDEREIDHIDLKPPTHDIVPKKNLDEYHIRAYERYSLIGHSTRVKCICVAPSENFFISCSNEDASMTMCSIENGKEIMSFMGHEDTIINACFSNDAKYLATTSRDNTMILWDVATGKQTLTFEHKKVVICCCFSKDSKLLVSGCQDKACRIWETKKGREQNSFVQHEGIIISVSFAPNAETIVSASADKTLRIWKVSDASPVHTLKGHTAIILSCTFRSDGKYIVSNDDRVLRVWDAVTGHSTLSLPVDEVPRPNTEPGKQQTWTLSSYCPGPLGFYVIAACNSKAVHVLHPETGEEILALYCKAPVYCLSCGSTSKVAFGDSYGNVFIVTLYAA
ncbi:putative WD repeat-containing protein [Diplonema papillatum]|nr:putative WD repeat-containing protein [Diplonema papillatum]